MKPEWQVLEGDCREVLKTLDDDSIDCCITSPPYFNMRDYGTGSFVGGDEDCDHKLHSKQLDPKNKHGGSSAQDLVHFNRESCSRCGAIRIDNQIGLESNIHEFVETMVEVFAEVKRVLKPSGTLWLNIGDSYAGSGGDGSNKNHFKNKTGRTPSRLKPKNLMGMPWRVAFALQEDGWILRNDIIWAKKNPFPMPLNDRCTSSHEHIFLFSKEPRYFFNWERIGTVSKYAGHKANFSKRTLEAKGLQSERQHLTVPLVARPRDVWTMGTASNIDSDVAHFARFPDELPRRCIEAGCPEEGFVLDPFSGSGTTGKVAVSLGRQYVGIELNPDYIELSKEKIAEGECMFMDKIRQTSLFSFNGGAVVG